MAKEKDTEPIDKTELIWPNKRKEVERVELPFETIETINPLAIDVCPENLL